MRGFDMNNFSTDSNNNRKQFSIGGKRVVSKQSTTDQPFPQFEPTPDAETSLDSIAFSLQRIADALDVIAGVDTNE